MILCIELEIYVDNNIFNQETLNVSDINLSVSMPVIGQF